MSLSFHLLNNNEITVNKSTGSSLSQPKCIKAPDNKFFCFWNSKIDDKFDLKCQKLDYNGNIIFENDYLINKDDVNNNYLIKSVELSNGKFFAAWISDRIDNYEIYGNYFNYQSFPDEDSMEFIIAQNLTGIKLISQTFSLPKQKAILITFCLKGSLLYGIIISENNDILKNPFLINSDYSTPKIIENNDLHTNCISYRDGKFLILWDSVNLDSYGKIYNSDYSVYKDEFKINTSETQSYFIAKLSSEEDKVIIFYQSSDSYYYNKIYSKIYDAYFNQLIKDEFIINYEYPDSTYTLPTLDFTDKNDEFLICWKKINKLINLKNEDVYCRYMDINGQFLTEEDFIVNKTEVVNQIIPFVLSLNNNQQVVSWTSNNNSAILLDFFYFYQKANTKIKLNQEKNFIKALNDGGFVIAWNCFKCDLYENGISMQIFDSARNKLGGEIIVNNYKRGIQQNPRIAVLNDSNFIICWEGRNTNDIKLYSIFCKIFNKIGKILKEEFLVANDNYYTRKSVDVVADKKENLVLITFIAEYLSNSNLKLTGIFAEVYSNEGNFIKGRFQINSNLDNNKAKLNDASIYGSTPLHYG